MVGKHSQTCVYHLLKLHSRIADCAPTESHADKARFKRISSMSAGPLQIVLQHSSTSTFSNPCAECEQGHSLWQNAAMDFVHSVISQEEALQDRTWLVGSGCWSRLVPAAFCRAGRSSNSSNSSCTCRPAVPGHVLPDVYAGRWGLLEEPVGEAKRQALVTKLLQLLPAFNRFG